MSNANAILVRQAYERYAEGDLAGVRDLIDLDLEWRFLDPSQADPEPQVCHGRHEFEHALERQQAQGLRSELEEVIGVGDKVVIVTHTPGLDALRARKADDRNVDVLTSEPDTSSPCGPVGIGRRRSRSPDLPDPGSPRPPLVTPGSLGYRPRPDPLGARNSVARARLARRPSLGGDRTHRTQRQYIRDSMDRSSSVAQYDHRGRQRRGQLFASGTWTATRLISFHGCGCGVVFGDPIPPDLCGGAVRFAATFSTPIGELAGTITAFCVVGDKVPASIGGPFNEGVTVDVPGIVSFNHPGGAENIYIQTG